MPGKYNQNVLAPSLLSFVSKVRTNLSMQRIYGTLLFSLLAWGAGYAQSPIPSPSPTPTPITKTGVILVDGSSTVGRITKWVGSTNNGTVTIGNSVITVYSVGTIGIVTNPFSDFKIADE